MTVIRTWTGVIRTDDRDDYRDYIAATGLDGYRSTPGNIDAWMLYRDRTDGTTEVVTVSLWESHEAIRGFAGDDITVARFYPQDDHYLIERDLEVKHYEVVG